VTRLAKRPHVNHTETAQVLRANPGRWIQVSTHRAGYAARNMARSIERASHSPAYQPAGSFQTWVKDRDDDSVVFARYVAERGEQQ